MENVFFEPWVGENYEPSGGIFHKRILVLGESHYCGETCEECGNATNAGECSKMTQNCFNNIILKGIKTKWTPTFCKFERSLVNEITTLAQSQEIWHSVAFYNFLQRALNQSRTNPTWEDFRASDNAFFDVLDQLKPQLIIAWGVSRMYKNLPGGDRWQKGTDLIIDDRNIKNGYYTLSDGTPIRILWVRHPSAGYSWDWWHKVIATEL